MCMNCGCGEPDTRHHPTDITREDLQRAADGGGMSLERTASNVEDSLAKITGGQSSPPDHGRHEHRPLTATATTRPDRFAGRASSVRSGLGLAREPQRSRLKTRQQVRPWEHKTPAWSGPTSRTRTPLRPMVMPIEPSPDRAPALAELVGGPPTKASADGGHDRFERLDFVSPCSARVLLTVRAARSSASSSLTPRSSYDSLTCSYWRSRLSLQAFCGIGRSPRAEWLVPGSQGPAERCSAAPPVRLPCLPAAWQSGAKKPPQGGGSLRLKRGETSCSRPCPGAGRRRRSRPCRPGCRRRRPRVRLPWRPTAWPRC